MHQGKDPERQPLLRSHSSRHGTAAPLGQSTLTQTVFNSTNVLLGVGLLSLPLGVKYAGWIIGLGLLVFSAVVTAYTAKVLARCMDDDKTLATYADLAFVSYGSRACAATRVLFSFLMIAACIALVILFGDVMNLLIPSLTTVQWKVLCGIILIPLQFVPFNLLSIASAVGVAASLGLVVLTILAGILKDGPLGSLRHPASTSAFPSSWTQVPLSIGLIFSPWGGHGVLPNLYRDMQYPTQYGQSILLTFSSTFAIDLVMAVCGYLMYGSETMDEIIANILVTPGHSRPLLITIVVLVAIMPVTKIPLSSRPLIGMFETMLGLDPLKKFKFEEPSSKAKLVLLLQRSGLRFLVVAVIIALSILCPSFDVIMALAGSALCLTICIILPLCFYLKMFQGRIGAFERIVDWALIVVAFLMAIAGTTCALLPKGYLGV